MVHPPIFQPSSDCLVIYPVMYGTSTNICHIRTAPAAFIYNSHNLNIRKRLSIKFLPHLESFLSSIFIRDPGFVHTSYFMRRREAVPFHAEIAPDFSSFISTFSGAEYKEGILVYWKLYWKVYTYLNNLRMRV